MPITTGMKGEGFYDRYSSPQGAAVAAVLPWLEEAIQQMRIQESQAPVVVVDYGCSEGRNSIMAMHRIVPALRGKTQRPIQTVHSDLSTNNFNQVFANLAPGGQSTFSQPQVYSAAVGGSMYEQLMPSGTVSVATTFNSIGFLDRRPETALPNHILPMGPRRPRPGVGVSDQERKPFADQARKDLTRFLRARAAELVPGGKLLLASFGVNEQYRCCDGIYDVLNDALLDMVDQGRLPRGAYEHLIIPVYFRSKEELVAPLFQTESEVSAHFRLERVESMEISVPFNENLKRGGDLNTYVGEFTGFLRAFSEPMLRLALKGEKALDALMEAVYGRVRARLLEDPKAYEFHYIQVATLLTRT